jgi:hypothetical protein
MPAAIAPASEGTFAFHALGANLAIAGGNGLAVVTGELRSGAGRRFRIASAALGALGFTVRATVSS